MIRAKENGRAGFTWKEMRLVLDQQLLWQATD